MEAPSTSEIRLTNRQSFPEWYAELKINATFRNVWHLVDPDAPDAPHLLSAEPPQPLTIDQMIDQLNTERNIPLAAWDADERPEAEKGPRPRAPKVAEFKDIKEEYTFRVKEYAIKQSTWTTYSARYQNIWDWVRRTVDQGLLAPHLELLVSEKRLSLQTIVRALRNKFEPSEDMRREQVREDYKKVLEEGARGRIEPQTWLNNWQRALARAQIHKVAEVEGFSAIKDFLQTVAKVVSPSWGSQQLDLVVEAHVLGEPIRTLEQYGKIVEALLQQKVRTHEYGSFATLGGRSDSPSNYRCPCKATRAEKHSWAPIDCSILELATKGSCARTLNPHPTAEQLKAVRERLQSKGFEGLRSQLQQKGWLTSDATSGTTSGTVQYPGNVSA